MSKTLTFSVPWAALCSKNAKYVGKFSKVLSDDYRAAQEMLGVYAMQAVKKQKWTRTDKALKLTWDIVEPDHRKRDPYNYGECILDALTKCTHELVWWDDSQVRVGQFSGTTVDKEKAGATITLEVL